MGMTITEIIKNENEIAAEFQKAVDTHIVNDDGFTLEEMYCDDSEVINDQLSRCKSLADYHKQIADTMNKYQRIQEIMKSKKLNAFDIGLLIPKDIACALHEIKEVIEDEKK